MTTDLITVGPGTNLIIVNDLMRNHEVRHVLVVDAHHELVGLVSQRDLLRASLSTDNSDLTELDKRRHLGSIKVDSIMNTNIQAVDPHATVATAASLMRRSKIGCLPVIESRKLVGLITEYDLLCYIESLPDNARGPERG